MPRRVSDTPLGLDKYLKYVREGGREEGRIHQEIVGEKRREW